MKRFILILIHSFILLFFISSLKSQTNNNSTKEQVKSIEQKMANLPKHEKKLNSLLLDIVDKITDENTKSNITGEEIAEKYSSTMSIIDNEARIYVKISVHDTTTYNSINKLVSDLENRDIIIENVYIPESDFNSRPVIFAKIIYSLIKEIAKDKRIANIATVIKPRTRIGSVTTQGDTLLNAELARLQHGVDGGTYNSIKIGVISDGIQGYLASMDSGDVNHISWISGHEQEPGSEGLAMIEIIQDIAPGSRPTFGSAFLNYGSQNLITVINELVTSWGCDIIVDDVYYLDDPMFQDGDLAIAIAGKISSDGITYISAAGNDGKSMWTGNMSTDNDSWHIWGKDGNNNLDNENKVYLTNGESIEIIMQWDDNWDNAENNYDLYLFNSMGTPVGSGGKTVQAYGNNQPPLETLQYTVPTSDYYYVRAKGVSGDLTRDIKVLADRLDLQYTYSYNLYGTSPTEQIYGHPAADGVISVAAFPADDPLVLEDFSSRGPTKLSPSTNPEERKTPVITATDGVFTGVPGFEIFDGTSASAPHIAGIAALYFDKYGSSKSNQDFFDDLTDNGQGIAGGTNGQWNMNSGYGKADAYFTLGDIPKSVTFYQYDSSGSYADSIGHWIGYWEKDRAPHTYDWGLFSNHRVKATEKIIDNEKYHHWNVDEYLNHKNVYVSAALPNQEAYLQPIVDSVSIKTELTAGGSGGNIEFKDPWYKDYNEPPYGYRNRGINPIWHTHGSPLNLTVASNYEGVFLDQGVTPQGQWVPPYYSVRAPQTQPINGIESFFLNWDATGADLQNANNLTTPVVFRQNNATVTAKYKGHLASNNPMATGYNNGRRMIRTVDGIYHLVYEDNNEIWYTHSTDGINWAAEERISDRYYPDVLWYKNPSISTDFSLSDNKIHVVWEKIYTGSFYIEHTVCYREFDGNTWNSIMSLSSGTFAGNETIYPTIFCKYDYIIIAWYIKTSNNEYVYIKKRSPYGLWKETIVAPGVEGQPVISLMTNTYGLKIIWSEGEEIKYIKGTPYSNTWTWSNIESLTDDLNNLRNHTNPSMYIDHRVNYLPLMHLAWEAERRTGCQSCHGGVSNAYYCAFNLNYSDPLPYGNITVLPPTYGPTKNTSIGGHPNQNTKIYYESGNNIINAERNTSGNSWSYIKSLDSGKNPSALENEETGAVWSVGNQAPYFLKTDLDGGTPQVHALETYKRFGFLFDPDENGGEEGFLALDLIELSLDNEDLELDEEENSEEVEPPQNNIDLSYALIVNACNLTSSLDLDESIINFYFNDGSEQYSLNSLELNEILNSDGTAIEQITQQDITILNLPADQGNIEVRFGEKEAIVMDMLVDQDSLSSYLAKRNIFINDPFVPGAYSLNQNYPNPFNPITTIQFDLPEAGKTKLIVYDIRGRVVSTLVNSHLNEGRYSYIFQSQNLASGLDFDQLTAGKFRKINKMMLVK